MKKKKEIDIEKIEKMIFIINVILVIIYICMALDVIIDFLNVLGLNTCLAHCYMNAQFNHCDCSNDVLPLGTFYWSGCDRDSDITENIFVLLVLFSVIIWGMIIPAIKDYWKW